MTAGSGGRPRGGLASRVLDEAPAAARAAASSLVATLVDGALYQLVLASAPQGPAAYAAAAAAGAFAGAVTNFTVNRYWAFRGARKALLLQWLQYAVGSLLTLGVLEASLWVLIDRLGVSARVAWLPAKVLAWGAFSYPFQRGVVFAGASE